MEPSITSAGVFALLGLGLVFGLKHATEVDHVVAVSTIVSEHRSVFRSALVGGLWGIGHTTSLVIVGVLPCRADLGWLSGKDRRCYEQTGSSTWESAYGNGHHRILWIYHRVALH